MVLTATLAAFLWL